MHQRDCPGSRAARVRPEVSSGGSFIEELQSGLNWLPILRVVRPEQLPPWSRQWRAELRWELTPVTLIVDGNGINYQVVLLVADGGVHAMWKDTEFEPN